jgi:hypothetical protein
VCLHLLSALAYAKHDRLVPEHSFHAQVPGFYDGVREGMLDAAVSRLEASDEFQLPAYQDSLGVPSFVSNTSQRCGPLALCSARQEGIRMQRLLCIDQQIQWGHPASGHSRAGWRHTCMSISVPAICRWHCFGLEHGGAGGGRQRLVTNSKADLQLGCCWLCICRVSCKRRFQTASPCRRRDLLSARWCEPSLSVVDVRVGDDTAAGDAEDAEGYRFGPTRFSVVPRSATGHVSIRFVPDQDAGRLFELFR